MPNSSIDSGFLNEPDKKSSPEVINIQPCNYKEPSLNLSFPSKASGYELIVLQQPEDQHRARYMTEGSRGAVKDKSGNGYPMVKVLLALYSPLLVFM